MKQQEIVGQNVIRPKLYGLIGYPLSHSFSKRYFTEKFEQEGLSGQYSYELFPIAHIEELPALLQAYPELCGFNVTIPYKRAIFPYLQECAEGVEAIGAVNTVKIEAGRLVGYNTDVIGFQDSLTQTLASAGEQPSRALVLGTGGAAKAVVWVLHKLGIQPLLVSRHPGPGTLAYPAIDEQILAQHRLIINTTPLGMSPELDTCPPIPYHLLTNRHILFDLVYNPEETLFLRRAKDRGATTQNGLPMLYGQAEAAWHIWQS